MEAVPAAVEAVPAAVGAVLAAGTRKWGLVVALGPLGPLRVYIFTSVDLSIKWTGSNSGIDNDSEIDVAELDQHSTDQVTGSSDMIK